MKEETTGYEIITSKAFPIFMGSYKEFQKIIQEKSLVMYFRPDCPICKKAFRELEKSEEFYDLISRLKIKNRIGINAEEPNDDNFEIFLNELFPQNNYPSFILYGSNNIQSRQLSLYGRETIFLRNLETLHNETFPILKRNNGGLIARLRNAAKNLF